MSDVLNRDYVLVQLTQNQVAIIDRKNVERVNSHIWHAQKNGREFYAYTWINGKHVQLANFILNHDTKDKNFQIDHINRHPLDNRECNLRKVTVSQNLINRGIQEKGGVYNDKYNYYYVANWIENNEPKRQYFFYGKGASKEERKKQKELAKRFREEKIKTLPNYIKALRLDEGDDTSLEDLSNIEISNSLLHANRRGSRIVSKNISYYNPKKGKPYLCYRSYDIGTNRDGLPKEKRIAIGTLDNPTYEIDLENLEQFKKETEKKRRLC